MRYLSSLFAPLAALLMLGACSNSASEGDAAPVVLAASSMQEAMQDVANAWVEQGHAAPVLSFAASSALARQIESGVPADIYVSADEPWMDELDKRKLTVANTRADLLSNSLVLIMPADDAQAAELGSTRIALADPEAVPAGRYAKASLESLGLWDKVQPQVVPAENVRAALALVERGEVKLGIVYATDALASKKVRVVRTFPANSHPPILYPVALLKTSTSDEASEFLDFLESDAARKIFASHGFGPAG